MIRRPPRSPCLPTTTLFRSKVQLGVRTSSPRRGVIACYRRWLPEIPERAIVTLGEGETPLVEAPALSERVGRSEEHTSELQSRQYLVCRLLLEKKNKT